MNRMILHLNLHLSSDGISSIVSTPIVSQGEKLNSKNGESVLPVDASNGPRTSQNASAVNHFPSVNEKGFDDIFDNTNCKRNSGHEVLDTTDSEGSDNDDISDAVELSVAASEALVIHDLVQCGTTSEPFSAAAILEVALRVKQARVDGLKDSLCCSKEDGHTLDILSDLSDSDMDNAYQDVGLSIGSMDNIFFKETSISRVRETPMSEFNAGQEREVQSEWQKDQDNQFENTFASSPPKNDLDTDELKDVPAGITDNEEQENMCGFPISDIICGAEHLKQHGNFDYLHEITQEGNIDTVNVDRFPHREVIFSPQTPHSVSASENFNPSTWHSEINKVNEKIACSFQSRWFGGWTGKAGDPFAGMELKGKKAIPKPFIDETSYLSESADLAPDQNSFVLNNVHSSKASESSIRMEDPFGAAKGGGLVDQDVLKDYTLSPIDPLCSVVPCSIPEMDSSSMAANNNDNLRALDANRSSTPDLNVQLETLRMSSGHKDESIRRDPLAVNTIGPCPIIRRQTKSLRHYSVGLTGSSTSLQKSFNCGFAAAPRKQERSCANDYNAMEPPHVRSTNCIISTNDDESHETFVLSVEHHISRADPSDEKVTGEKPSFKSTFIHTKETNNEEIHGTPSLAYTCERSVQDFTETNAKNEAELQVHQQDIPTSPLVLCHRTRRRFKAPQLLVTDISAAIQPEDQAPGFDMICLKSTEDQHKICLDIDVPSRKRVRFSETVVKSRPRKNLRRALPSYKSRSSCRVRDRSVSEHLEQEQGTTSQEVKERLTNFRANGRKRAIFQGLEFLLTGFSKKKEKEIEGLLRKHGGVILSDIPSPPSHSRGRSSRSDVHKLPVIICTKKLQTSKFLYGCAVNAFLLKVPWAFDSIRAGSVVSPDKYVISSNQTNRKLNQIGKSVHRIDDDYVFDKVGIMLHGRHSFCSKLDEVIKHGRGQVYKSLHWLVQSLERKKISLGAIIAEDETRATRHLKKCASEQKIPMMPASWIINSLFEGKLLPFKENYHSSISRAPKIPEVPAQDWSQEI